MNEPYSQRLQRLQTARWKRLLNVQGPYRAHLRSLRPGLVLEIGCGIGRNLQHLDGHAVGVDIDAESVRYVRDTLGLEAYTPADFAASRHAQGRPFDTLLLAHVLEHMEEAAAVHLLQTWLPRVRTGGRVIVITPQERGQASDPTHVRMVDFDAVRALALRVRLQVLDQHSFPFPRAAGRLFKYNEFVTVLQLDD